MIEQTKSYIILSEIFSKKYINKFFEKVDKYFKSKMIM